MITQYHRPKTLTEALALIAQPKTYPLGGGIMLTRFSNEDYEVVDLQALELNVIRKKGNTLEIGATATLQSLLDFPETPPALKKAIRHEASLNTRNAASIAGTLVASDGRSPFAVMMMALDAKITLRDSNNRTEEIQLGDFLPLRAEKLPHKLITQICVPLNVKTAYEYVARTPADKPIVCAATCQWTAGRTRLVLGGWEQSPTLAMDGKGTQGIASAAQNAAYEANDVWASAEYRRDVAVTLAQRCLR
jgi:CO/xanthine dehydrogenase FAD-binding subunit